MKEFNVEKKLLASIESSVGNLNPTKTRGGCDKDAETVIRHLTKKNRYCKTGIALRLIASDFDAPTDMLTIYANGEFTQVDYHEVALMDKEIIVDLARERGNRVFSIDDYFNLMTRLQR